ncbi:protein kinase domain-containing protein [Actinacidiphila alni]|uniref:protein kinase domain-containing protein n=1 Tax=Actinacidiphila alni TaxID=380248 RepID=UPI003453D8CF
MGAQHTGPDFGRPVFQPLTADDPAEVSGYRISARLGTGDGRRGGRVYLAHAPGGSPVALRLLAPATVARPGFAARFPHDAHTLRQVHGPYVVPYVDSGTGTAGDPGAGAHDGGAPDNRDRGGRDPNDRHPNDGDPDDGDGQDGRPDGGEPDGTGPWLATGYVPGLSLRTAVDMTGPLPVPSVLRLVAGIAEALRTLHHAGVVHGDLSPAQVLLAADGPRVKDFGLAGITGAAPVFAAPEQAAGKPTGPASDVFALGRIAVHAAIGTPVGGPPGTGPADEAPARSSQDDPDLNELPGELREIVTRCLIKDPALRPSPAQIIAMCAQAAPDAALRRADRWLPPALLAAIVPAMPPPAPPIPLAPPPAGPPSPLHYGWARPTAHLPQYRPHLPHLPHLQRTPARRRGGTVVAAVAALAVAAVAGAVVMGRTDGGGSDHRVSGAAPTSPAAGGAPSVRPSPSGPGATTRPADPGTGGGDATGSPEPPPLTPGAPVTPSGPAGTLYRGLQLPAGYGLSFVTDPPVLSPGPLTGDIGYTEQAEAFATEPEHGTLALLDPRAPATLAGCESGTFERVSIPRRAVADGTRLCLRTSDGTVALVVFRAFSPLDAPAPSASLDVTVWRVGGRAAEAGQGDAPPNQQALGPANLAHFLKTV